MHDIGVFFSLQSLPMSLTIVLINNSGGGIFSFLPISEQKDIFETYFATEHSFHLGKVVEAMGISVQAISSMEDLKIELQNPVQGISVLEVFTNRDINRAEHQTISRFISETLESLELS